jgi:hypothetical protein
MMKLQNDFPCKLCRRGALFQSRKTQSEAVASGVDLVLGADIGSAGGGTETSLAAVAVDKDAIFLNKFPAVEFPPELLAKIPEEKRDALLGVLAQDPRPRYQNTPGRVYAMGFAGFTIKFTVDGETLTVKAVEKG